VEVQFSNYPFVLNNLLRSELFFQTETHFTDVPPKLLIIITKAGNLPASNSTLYYEQARDQFITLANGGVFDIPIRLVKLSIPLNEISNAKQRIYTATRYSREVAQEEDINVTFTPGRTNRSRPKISIYEGEE
jgi:hypothetical protein